MTKDTIYLKSGDAFIIMWEDSVEILQKDGNSCIARRLEGKTVNLEEQFFVKTIGRGRYWK